MSVNVVNNTEYSRANILWLRETFEYLFRFPGDYYKVTTIVYWIEVLPFVGLKESIIGDKVQGI